jgi:hypothetical protein
MTSNLPDRMLDLMADGDWHSQEELIDKISHRFSATKHVLHKQGYQFERRHLGKKRYSYRLINGDRSIA